LWICPFWERDSSEQIADNRRRRPALRTLPCSAGFQASPLGFAHLAEKKCRYADRPPKGARFYSQKPKRLGIAVESRGPCTGGFVRFEEQFERANQRARRLRASAPRAVAACFDRRTGRIVIELNSRLEVGLLPHMAEGLEQASPAELEQGEITPSGYGIHFPKLDVDLYLPALLQGFTGSRKWMASGLGRVGGASRSRAKVAAARKNGKLGGRPRMRGRG
jgi:hypothetical protein